MCPTALFSGHTNESQPQIPSGRDIIFVLASTDYRQIPSSRARRALPCRSRISELPCPSGPAACATNCNDSRPSTANEPLEPKDSERPTVNIPDAPRIPSRSSPPNCDSVRAAPEILADARGHRPRGAEPKHPPRHVRLPAGTRPCAEKPLRRRRPGCTVR